MGVSLLQLLATGDPAAWHRIAAPELWLFQGGDPLELTVVIDDDAPGRHVLGTEVIEGEEPQVLVPTGAWRSARTLGSWSLAGRVVSPDVRSGSVELAPAGWRPGARADDPAGADAVASRRRRA